MSDDERAPPILRWGFPLETPIKNKGAPEAPDAPVKMVLPRHLRGMVTARSYCGQELVFSDDEDANDGSRAAEASEDSKPVANAAKDSSQIANAAEASEDSKSIANAAKDSSPIANAAEDSKRIASDGSGAKPTQRSLTLSSSQVDCLLRFRKFRAQPAVRVNFAELQRFQCSKWHGYLNPLFIELTQELSPRKTKPAITIEIPVTKRTLTKADLESDPPAKRTLTEADLICTETIFSAESPLAADMSPLACSQHRLEDPKLQPRRSLLELLQEHEAARP